MAVDYYLKIDGVPGESTDAKHKGEIDLESFSWGETNSADMANRGGLGAGKVSMSNFNFVMKVNKASPTLMIKCATGEHIKSAILTCRKAGKDQQEFNIITLSDVMVTSYQTGGSSHGELPMDQVSLAFSKIEYEYKEQKPDGTLGGSVKKTYDIKQNKAI